MGRKQKERKRGRYAEKTLKGQKAAIKEGKKHYFVLGGGGGVKNKIKERASPPNTAKP